MSDDADRPLPGVTVTDGPYLVRGTPLVRRREVLSEAGEPLTWQTTAELDPGEEYALCRCGGSSNKPFCDGSHQTNGVDGTPFDGTESAPTGDYAERARVMPAPGVTVSDDRSICEHAGFCATAATNVWKMTRGEATADTATRSQLMAMVERCPSGALTYALDEDGPTVEPDLRRQVGVVADGPLFLSGGVTVERADGQRLETRNRMTLCRCGASKNKPLCDGSHKEVGFRDSGPAGADRH